MIEGNGGCEKELRRSWWGGSLEGGVSLVLRQISRAVTLGVAQGVVSVLIKVEMILCRIQIGSQWMLEKKWWKEIVELSMKRRRQPTARGGVIDLLF